MEDSDQPPTEIVRQPKVKPPRKREAHYHHQLLAMMASGRYSQAAAARALGISEDAVCDWMQRYRQDVQRMARSSLRETLEVLAEALPDSARLLMKIVKDDPELRPSPDEHLALSLRRDAAVKLLQMYQPFKEGVDLEERMAKLEAELRDRMGRLPEPEVVEVPDEQP